MNIQFVFENTPYRLRYNGDERRWSIVSERGVTKSTAIVEHIIQKTYTSKDGLLKELHGLGIKNIEVIDGNEGERLETALSEMSFEGNALLINHGIVQLKKTFEGAKPEFFVGPFSVFFLRQVLHILNVDVSRPFAGYFEPGYWPELEKVNLTVSDLLNHTSGLYQLEELRDGDHPLFSTYHPPEMVAGLIMKKGFTTPPGGHYFPTVSNSVLLALLIEKLTSEPIDLALQRYLPLAGLLHTQIRNSSFVLQTTLDDMKEALTHYEPRKPLSTLQGPVDQGFLVKKGEERTYDSGGLSITLGKRGFLGS